MGLENLPLVRLRFELEALEETAVPMFKGDMLRQALLWWLSEAWCLQGRCRQGCQAPDRCLFGQLCRPPLDPEWPLEARRLMGDSPPPAYTVWDEGDRRTRLWRGAEWTFEVGLVGELALDQMADVIAAMAEGAERGLGRLKLRNRVRQVTALRGMPFGPTVEHTLAERRAGDRTGLNRTAFRRADVVTTYGQAEDWVASLANPVQALTLRFLSPTKIKERHEWVELPSLSVVMRAVVRRLRLLSWVYGGEEWPQAAYGPLLDLAETAATGYHEMQWLGYLRESKQSGEHPVEGFIGPIWYEGEDWRPLLPALWLGQWLHIGKFYVVGNGRYRVEGLYS